MHKIALAGLMTLSFGIPAQAQESSYYIIRDATTKRCTITHEKPTGSSVTIVSGDKIYKTETEDQGALKTTKVCTEE